MLPRAVTGAAGAGAECGQQWEPVQGTGLPSLGAPGALSQAVSVGSWPILGFFVTMRLSGVMTLGARRSFALLSSTCGCKDKGER